MARNGGRGGVFRASGRNVVAVSSVPGGQKVVLGEQWLQIAAFRGIGVAEEDPPSPDRRCNAMRGGY